MKGLRGPDASVGVLRLLLLDLSPELDTESMFIRPLSRDDGRGLGLGLGGMGCPSSVSLPLVAVAPLPSSEFRNATPRSIGRRGVRPDMSTRFRALTVTQSTSCRSASRSESPRRMALRGMVCGAGDRPARRGVMKAVGWWSGSLFGTPVRRMGRGVASLSTNTGVTGAAVNGAEAVNASMAGPQEKPINAATAAASRTLGDLTLKTLLFRDLLRAPVTAAFGVIVD